MVYHGVILYESYLVTSSTTTDKMRTNYSHWELQYYNNFELARYMYKNRKLFTTVTSLSHTHIHIWDNRDFIIINYYVIPIFLSTIEIILSYYFVCAIFKIQLNSNSFNKSLLIDSENKRLRSILFQFFLFSFLYTAAMSEFRILLKSFSLDPGYLLSSGDTTRVNAFFLASACASNSSIYDVNSK